MAKAHARRKRKAIRILREPRFEFGIARILQGGHICSEEIHLLHHAALDDLVILVQPKGTGFTEENLLAHPLLDQCAHLVSRRRRPTLGEPVHRQLAEVILREYDLIDLVGPVGGRVHQFVDCEENAHRREGNGGVVLATTCAQEGTVSCQFVTRAVLAPPSAGADWGTISSPAGLGASIEEPPWRRRHAADS